MGLWALIHVGRRLAASVGADWLAELVLAEEDGAGADDAGEGGVELEAVPAVEAAEPAAVEAPAAGPVEMAGGYTVSRTLFDRALTGLTEAHLIGLYLTFCKPLLSSYSGALIDAFRRPF